MHVITRARLFLLRHPSVHWAAVAVACAVVIAALTARLRDIDAERRSWGETRTVLIAAHDAAAGEPLRTTSREVPHALVPDSAVGPDTTIDRVRQRVGVGEIVVESDVVDRAGPAALADPDQVVVAIVDPFLVPTETGVEATVHAEGVVLAERAIVVGVHDEVVLVAVDARDAPSVAEAALAGTASLGYPG